MNLVLLATASVLIYLCRYSGFALKVTRTSPFWESFLRFVPLSVFAALVVSSLYTETELLSIKLVALAIAGGVYWRTGRFGLSILTGLGVLMAIIIILGE